MVALIIIAVTAVLTTMLLSLTDLPMSTRAFVQVGVMLLVGWGTAMAGYSVRDW